MSDLLELVRTLLEPPQICHLQQRDINETIEGLNPEQLTIFTHLSILYLQERVLDNLASEEELKDIISCIEKVISTQVGQEKLLPKLLAFDKSSRVSFLMEMFESGFPSPIMILLDRKSFENLLAECGTCPKNSRLFNYYPLCQCLSRRSKWNCRLIEPIRSLWDYKNLTLTRAENTIIHQNAVPFDVSQLCRNYLNASQLTLLRSPPPTS